MHETTKTFEPGVLTPIEFARLGDGEVAYIKQLTSDEAEEMFPMVDGIPNGIALFALHGADGTPLALTDSLSAALAHAIEDDLEVTALH